MASKSKGTAAKKAGKAKKKAPKKVSAAAKDRAKKGASAAAGTKPVTKKQRAAAAQQPAARKVPSAGQLQTLLGEVVNRMANAATQNAKGRQAIAQAKKDIHLNPVAFGMIRRLIAMGEREPNALMVCLEDFDLYRDLLKVDDLAGENMFKESGTNEASDQTQEDGEVEETDIPPGDGADDGARPHLN